jgi:hypothetical protein
LQEFELGRLIFGMLLVIVLMKAEGLLGLVCTSSLEN